MLWFSKRGTSDPILTSELENTNGLLIANRWLLTIGLHEYILQF